MITTYDLERCTPIAIDDSPSRDLVLDPSEWAELRLELLTPTSSQQASATRDFSAVIGQQVLAQLSR